MVDLTRIIRRYTSISAAIDILRRRELPLLDPQSWDDRNDRYFMNLYKSKKNIKGLYGLCAARCSETYHHWRVFTNSSDGACLELRRKPLEDALNEISGVRYGEVEYLKLEEVEALTAADIDRLPFIKRIGFNAEKEYRIVAAHDEAQSPAISVDLSLSWVSQIYLNPWLPKSIAESVSETLKAMPDCDRIKISKSLLIDSGRWKRAGDRVVGEEQPERKKLSKDDRRE